VSADRKNLDDALANAARDRGERIADRLWSDRVGSGRAALASRAAAQPLGAKLEDVGAGFIADCPYCIRTIHFGKPAPAPWSRELGLDTRAAAQAPAEPADAQIESVAIVLWHRFGADQVETWEDEIHKAEYRAAASAVLRLSPLAGQASTQAPAEPDARTKLDERLRAWQDRAALDRPLQADEP